MPLPILLLRKRKLRHSLGKPSRSDFVQLEIICQTFGITLAEFFNDTDVLVSMTEEEKNMLSQWNLLTPAQRTAVINIIGLLLSCD